MNQKSQDRRFFRDVLPRILEAATVWAVVAGVIGWVTWKELARKPEVVETGREIYFTAQEVRGVKPRSPLLCQGIVVGEVTSIEPVPKADGGLKILIKATLAAKFQSWAFKETAEASSGGVASAMTGAPIDLTFQGLLSTEELIALKSKPQHITLAPPEDTGRRVRQLLTEAETILAGFSSKVPAAEIPADWSGTAPPSRIELITHNLIKSTDGLKTASAHLDYQMNAQHQDSLMSDLRQMKGNIDLLTEETENLLVALRQTIASIDGKMNDVLGATPAERGRLRRELGELLGSATQVLDQVADMVPRIGDTFWGRRLIRSQDAENSTE